VVEESYNLTFNIGKYPETSRTAGYEIYFNMVNILENLIGRKIISKIKSKIKRNPTLGLQYTTKNILTINNP
jgi:hypothetical protein